MARAHRDIIVIGTSAGGVDALSRLVAGFPADLAAAVLIVMHMAPTFPRMLADRLATLGPLPAAEAVDGELIRPNRIYLCVPDRHLLIDGGRLRLTRGPKENHSRPSIDALFRSAAFYCGARVIGVVLTGQLDDGTAGLWTIKDRGGLAVVQDPAEAAFPSMPQSAVRQVPADHTLGIAAMGPLLHRLAREEVVMADEPDQPRSPLHIETSIASGDSALDSGVRELGNPTVYTCPDCHGVLFGIREGPLLRFRCHTGHAYSARSLAQQTLPEIEKSLWMALAQLEEYEMLLNQVGEADELLAPKAQQIARLRLQLRELLRDSALVPAGELSAQDFR